MIARTLGLVVLAMGAAGCASSGADDGSPKSVQVPRPFELVDMDGARHDLDADLAAGKAVVLVWWQTWCASCRAEAPELAAAAREHADHLRFIGVVPGTDDNVDDGEVRDVARDLGLTYPNVRDRDLALTGALGVTGTPTIIVLAGSPAQVVWTGHHLPPELGAFGRATTP